jgi:hypothetical protein
MKGMEEVNANLVNVFKRLAGGEKLELVIGLPGSGRSTLLRQVAYQPKTVGIEFKKTVEKRIWVVVNLPAEAELEKYWDESPYTQNIKKRGLKEAIEEVINQGRGVGWIVNSADSINKSDKTKSLWNEILAWYYKFPKSINFLLGQGCEEVGGVEEMLGDLVGYYRANQNWIKLGEEKVKDGGGYWPLEERLSQKKVGVEDEVVDSALEILWQSCSDTSREQLINLVRHKPKDFNQYLINTGVVKNEEGEWRLFSPLFEGWIKKMIGQQKPVVDEREGKLWLGKQKLEDELSYQEYQVLRLLWDNINQLVTRGKIAEVIWPVKTEEKYSDWAIDQLLTKVRRKIGDFGQERLIKTVRGQGVRLDK